MQYVLELLSRDFSLPIFLVAVGALAWLVTRRDPVALLVLLLFFSYGVIFVIIANIDLDRTFRFAMKVFFIPLALAVVIPLAILINRIVEVAGRHTTPPVMLGVYGLLLLSPALPVTLNYGRCNYAHYWYAEDHARNMIASMLPRAMVFASGDHNTFPLMYMTMVAGGDNDIIVADKYGYVDPAVLQSIVRNPLRLAKLESEALRREWLIRLARRPVYYTIKSSPPVDNAVFVPVGIVYHLLPRSREIDRDAPWGKIRYRNLAGEPSVLDLGASHILSDYFFFRGLYHLGSGEAEAALDAMSESARYGHGIKECFNNIGSALAEHQLLDQAVEYFEQARHTDPRYATPRRNLARIYLERKQWNKAEACLHELIRISPRDSWPYKELGFLALRHHDNPALARRLWEQSLQRNPDQPELLEALNRVNGE